MQDHRCRQLLCLGTLRGDITPSTYRDTSELSHLPEELSPAQGFQAALPRLQSSHQGHSCSWDSYSRFLFPPNQIQYGDEPMLCHYILLHLNRSQSTAGIRQHTLRKGSGASAATAQPKGTPTGRDPEWRVSWSWTQFSFRPPAPNKLSLLQTV